VRLQGPQSQDAAASPAILILSSGYRPFGSSTRLSGLSRSDFVQLALFGHGTISDLGPQCAAKPTSPTVVTLTGWVKKRVSLRRAS
jgi:hypothetical protein